MPIFTAADWGYRGPLKVMLSSLARHQVPGQLQVVRVLTPEGDLPRWSAWWESRPAALRIEFVAIDPRWLSQFTSRGHVGLMTYARLALDSLGMCPWDRALYLDSDILVRGSLAPLHLRVASQVRPIAGVQELEPATVSSPGGVFNWVEMGLPAARPYVNAGVLGLNLATVRETGLFRRALEYLGQHGKFVAAWDQGALNAVMTEAPELWPVEFNFTSSHLRHRAGRRKRADEVPWTAAVVAHFTGAGVRKPWHVNSSSPFVGEYLSYCSPGDLDAFPARNSRLELWFGPRAARLLRLFSRLIT